MLTPPDEQHYKASTQQRQTKQQSENIYINSDEKIILRQHTHNSNQANKRIVRRSYILDSQQQQPTVLLTNSDENIRKNETTTNYETPKSLMANKRAAFNSVRGQSSINSKISLDGSLMVNSPRSRYNSPQIFKIFNSSTPTSQNTSINNTPNFSATSSSSSSISPTLLLARNKFESHEQSTPIVESNEMGENNQVNSSNFVMENLERQKVNITSAKEINGHQVKPRTLAINEAREVNGRISSKAVSPLNCMPRKLFNPNELLVSPVEKLADTFSMSGSLYLDNSSSTTDASTGTGRIADKSGRGESNYTELYLNDEAMYKKEAGSVCEFVSNRLDSNNNNISRQSPSATSLDATTSLSSSLNSTPVSTPTNNIKSNFRIASTHAKLIHGKQVDLKRVPLKAEIHESLNSVRDSLLVKEPSIDKESVEVEHDQPPQPPVRRSKKLHQSDNVFQLNSLTTRNEMKLLNLNNVNMPRYESPKMPPADNSNDGSMLSPKPVVYRNRSNSSSTYENIERLNMFHQKYGKTEASSEAATNFAVNKLNDCNSNEQSIRNGLYIDLNMIKDLRSKKLKPQFVSLISFIFLFLSI